MSPPPPTRITTPHTFAVCQQANKQNHCTVNLIEHECKFSFFAPHRHSVQKVQTSSITPNSVQVSPPPPSRIMTAYSLTEWQMAFIGPHHISKILGKNHQSTTKVTLNEPPIKMKTCLVTYGIFYTTEPTTFNAVKSSIEIGVENPICNM